MICEENKAPQHKHKTNVVLPCLQSPRKHSFANLLYPKSLLHEVHFQ
jgi:hypothetical protein